MRSAMPAFVFLLLASSVLAEEGPGRGPLPVRDQFSFELITLGFTPRSAGWLERGQWSAELGLVYSNTFEITEDLDQRALDFSAGLFQDDYAFVADGETARAHLRVDFGVSSRVQLGLEIPVLSHGGGFLDSIIDTTHDSLGLPGNSRDDRPQDELEFDLIAGSERFRLDDGSTELGDVVASAKIGLHRGDRSAVSMILEAKAPTGDEGGLAGSGSWDYGLSFVGSVSGLGGRHVAHWGLGYVSVGEPEQLPIDFDDQVSGYFGYEFRPNERWSVVAQVQAETSALPDKPGARNGDERLGLAVGFHRGGENWQLSAGVLENLTTNDNTLDLGLFFVSSWRR